MDVMVKMICNDSSSPSYGKIDEFTEVTANSVILMREGWVRYSEPVIKAAKDKKETAEASNEETKSA